MKRLRSYAPLSKRSDKVKAEQREFLAVYADVDRRSEGRCEVSMCGDGTATRCSRRAVEHHHLFKPRRAHHTAREVVHVCRADHERMEYPFKRGRLCFVGIVGAEYLFMVRYASSKFEDRGQG